MWRGGGNCNHSDIDSSMIVGARWAGLSFAETAHLLGLSHSTVSSQNGVKNKQASSEQQFTGQKRLVDERGQRIMAPTGRSWQKGYGISDKHSLLLSRSSSEEDGLHQQKAMLGSTPVSQVEKSDGAHVGTGSTEVDSWSQGKDLLNNADGIGRMCLHEWIQGPHFGHLQTVWMPQPFWVSLLPWSPLYDHHLQTVNIPMISSGLLRHGSESHRNVFNILFNPCHQEFNCCESRGRP